MEQLNPGGELARQLFQSYISAEKTTATSQLCLLAGAEMQVERCREMHSQIREDQIDGQHGRRQLGRHERRGERRHERDD